MKVKAKAKSASKLKEIREKAKERTDKIKSRLEDANEKLKKAGEEIKENRATFRKWKHRNPDDDISCEFDALKAQPKTAARQQRMDELVMEYVNKHARARCTKAHQATDANNDTTRHTKLVLSYVDACVRYSLSPVAASSSGTLESFCKLGVIKKIALRGKELSQAKEFEAEFGHGVCSKYEVVVHEKIKEATTSAQSTVKLETEAHDEAHQKDRA